MDHPEQPKASEGATDNQSADSAKPKRHPRHTIASLRLDIEAAEAGRFWELLPFDIRRTDEATAAYPLPADIKEVHRISLVQTGRSVKSNSSGLYILRARKAYASRRKNLASGTFRIEQQVEAARAAHYRLKKTFDEQRRDINAEIDAVRVDIAKKTASISTLYDLMKQGSEMILKGFVEGAEVHGDKVSIADFQRTAGLIASHTQKIGLPSTDAKPAEEAIFAEAQAAIEAIRRDVDATLDTSDPKKPEVAH